MDDTSARRPFRIDPNVRLGDLLILGTMAFGVVMAWASLREGQERNSHDLVTMQSTQRERDAQQDAVVNRIEGSLKDGIQQIRSEQVELRREVGEIGRYVRGANRGG
jgi:hypothetical protein